MEDDLENHYLKLPGWAHRLGPGEKDGPGNEKRGGRTFEHKDPDASFGKILGASAICDLPFAGYVQNSTHCPVNLISLFPLSLFFLSLIHTHTTTYPKTDE